MRGIFINTAKKMKTISIKSVLAGLAMIIDERYWDESVMLEHIAKGFLQMNLESKYEQKVANLQVTEHKATLPEDLKYITQMVVAVQNKYYPMRATTNPYHNSICDNKLLAPCPTCKYEYSISPSGVITTNMHDGEIVVAYLAIPTDENGDLLIPDDETLKEALTHYVLYKYWLTKYMMKEEGSEGRMQFHLKMWSTLSKKAMNLNLPTIDKLENLKNINNHLVPRNNRYSQLFQTLYNQENVGF